MFDVLNIISIQNNVMYETMPKNNGIESTLYLKAEIKLNSKIQINARVIPQPKHETPKRFFIGHNERLKILVRI